MPSPHSPEAGAEHGPTTGPTLVFGGSFDPPHLAHVRLAREAAAAEQIEHVLFVPARVSPHKLDDPPTDATHRLAMLRLALDGHDWASVSTIELERPGPSYTVVTLETLRADDPDRPLRLLMGMDQALGFRGWRAWERILELARPLVLVRPPWSVGGARAALSEVHGLESGWASCVASIATMDVSASAIRRRLERGAPTEGLLDPAVAAYIRTHGLYRPARTADGASPRPPGA